MWWSLYLLHKIHIIKKIHILDLYAKCESNILKLFKIYQILNNLTKTDCTCCNYFIITEQGRRFLPLKSQFGTPIRVTNLDPNLIALFFKIGSDWLAPVSDNFLLLESASLAPYYIVISLSSLNSHPFLPRGPHQTRGPHLSV